MHQRLIGQRRFWSAIFSALLCISLGSGFLTAPASAASDKPSYRLQVSPTQASLGDMDPGKTYSGTFRIHNTGALAYHYSLSIAPYSVSDQTYNPNFSTPSSYTEMTNWISLPSVTGEVAAGSSKEVAYHITIPRDAPGNAQNAAILVSLEIPDNSEATGFKTTRQVAFLLYGNVTGTTRKSGAVLANNYPGILLTPDFTATATVKNTGNINTIADVTLEIRSLVDEKILFSNTGEKTGRVVFPETERTITTEWPSAPQLGLFRVRQSVRILDETSVSERLVFICPPWFLAVLLTMTGLIIAWVVQKILLATGIIRRRQKTARKPVATPKPAHATKAKKVKHPILATKVKESQSSTPVTQPKKSPQHPTAKASQSSPFAKAVREKSHSFTRRLAGVARTFIKTLAKAFRAIGKAIKVGAVATAHAIATGATATAHAISTGAVKLAGAIATGATTFAPIALKFFKKTGKALARTARSALKQAGRLAKFLKKSTIRAYKDLKKLLHSTSSSQTAKPTTARGVYTWTPDGKLSSAAPASATVAITPEPKREPKPEPKLASKLESQPELQPEPKPESKPEPGLESTPEPEPTPKPRPEPKTTPKPGSQPTSTRSATSSPAVSTRPVPAKPATSARTTAPLRSAPARPHVPPRSPATSNMPMMRRTSASTSGRPATNTTKSTKSTKSQNSRKKP